ncbi:MAG: FtsX-like permease family protein [Candidatus Latescibacteria bacterium]|nr:FtsX-like permease family protein [Candidatus Latescibacterota bacterium]
MAWRDSRTYRRRMALFLSCILLGVAALVAVRSLGDNLEQTINNESRTLLGADLVIRSQHNFSEEVNALIDSIGGEQTREVRFASMVYFPKTDGTRLVQIRALTGAFPYYGTFETEPIQAAYTYQTERTALLDDGLLIQFGIDVGDSVRIGNHTFVIGGRIKKIPGEAMAFSTIAPRVYIPLADLDKTDLIKYGSLASYLAYFKLDNNTNIRDIEKNIQPYREENRLRTETVASRQRRLNRTLGNLYSFLNLVAFSALLLGCIGVASAIHVYMRQKQATVAILRCLGAQSGQVLTIYAVQTAALGLIGSTLGAIVGLGIQYILPQILANFLPIELTVQISYPAIFQGMIIGIGLSLLFALLPLLPVRHTSPLRTLRASFEEVRNRIDPLQVLTFLFIVVSIALLSILQTNRIGLGLGITAGFFIAFALLMGAANLMIKTIKRFFPTSWQYVWRQGLANLYRPNNQTSILMLALGLGTFLIATLYIVQHALISQVAIAGDNNRPNLVLVDVQTDQKEGVATLIQNQNLPLIHQAPVVTMRLSHIKGYPANTYQKEFNVSRWSLSREYRSTYRNHIYDSETVISGTWHNDTHNGDEPVPVSLEKSIAQNLKVTLGDTLTFNVQGIPIITIVQSLREVDWQRIQPNFFVVFPNGVLEPAPQFHVFTTRVTSTEQSAQLQRQLVKTYPNVSAVDLGLILQTVDDVLSQVSFVIRFMALFSVFTGLIVLASAVTTSRYQRVQEAVLLRTLGASKSQIRRILLLEYLFLGALAALTGLLLSIGGAWALSTFVFNIGFALPSTAIIGVFALVTLLTVCVGMLNSRGIADRPPLEILRSEG